MANHVKVLFAIGAAFALAFALAGCSPSGAGSSSSTSTASGSSSATSGSTASGSASASSAATTASSSSASAPSEDDTAIIDLDYNAGTGYEWTYEAEPEDVVELVDQETEDLAAGQNVDGGGLVEHFTFRAKEPGEVVLTFNLVRSWEPNDPAETQVYAFTVNDDMQLILNPYKSDFENEPR